MRNRFLAMMVFIIVTCCLFASTTIDITGSTTVYPILKAAAEAYMNRWPDVRINIEATGSSVGVAGILEGRVDIGAASREIKSSELDRAGEVGVDPVATVIAMDGIAVVTHPDNPVNELTIEQLKSIYAGQSTNWSELGGEDAHIQVISRDGASGTYEVFSKIVLGDSKLTLGALVVASNQSVVEVVTQSEHAIGFIGVGYLNNSLKALSIDGELPTAHSIRSRHYKLARALNLFTNGEPGGESARFIEFLLSPDGQQIVRREGFVPMK